MVHYLQSFDVQNLMHINDVSKGLLHVQASCGIFFFSNIFFHTEVAPFFLKIEIGEFSSAFHSNMFLVLNIIKFHNVFLTKFIYFYVI
jgi:hypothetical protein